MKIYISLDMEGIGGTFNWQQETKDRSQVIFAMKKQLEFILEGIHESALNRKITDIIIADSHSSGDNIPWAFTELDERISLISGSPRPYYMMPHFSEEYDRVFLIGYHAGTGALKGNMDHTYSNGRVHRMTVNGKVMNEALLNTAYASEFGVPVTLVSGDLTLKNEMIQPDIMPWIDFITTKEAISKFSAVNYSLHRIRNASIEAVKSALEKDRQEYPLYRFDSPAELRITFNSSSYADVAQMIPYTKRLDGRTVSFTDEDYKIVFEAMMALVTIAYTVNP